MRHSQAWCETGDCLSREGRGAPGLEAGAAGQRQSPWAAFLCSSNSAVTGFFEI